MRYHRLQKRAAKADSKAVAPASSPLLPTQRGRDEHVETLRELADTLESLRPPGRVAVLRHLAEYADDLLLALETIEKAAWSLDELPDVALTLEDLGEHRDTLEHLAQLDDLADDVTRLARAVRHARCCNEELDWALDELEALDENG